MELPPLLLYALSVAVYLKYPLIFLGTTVGGPALILASGALIHEGVLELVPLFTAVALGELTLDAIWYWLGHHYADKFVVRYGRYFSMTPQVFEKIKRLFEKYDVWVLFISKIAMGFGFIIAILITAGATRIPFWKYMLLNALGEVVWVSVVLALGYYFGELASIFAVGFKYYFIAGLILVALTILFGVGRAIRKRLF